MNHKIDHLDTLHIRKVTDDDLQALREFSQSTFIQSFGPVNKAHNMDAYIKVAFSEQQLKKEVDHPSSEFFFAELQNQIVGYLKLNVHEAQTELMGKNAMEIERIYVASAHQGQGIGKQLINFAKEKGRANSMQILWLGVWEHNDKALLFYHRQGFEVFDKHIFTFGDEEQQDLLLKFRIP